MAQLFVPRARKPTIIQGRSEIELDVFNTIKRLHEIDPALSVIWNEDKDRYEIWRKAEDKDHLIFTVQNEDGSFRELDQRVVERIKEIDSWTGYNAALECEQADEKGQQEKQEKFKETMREEVYPRLKHAIKKDLITDP